MPGEHTFYDGSTLLQPIADRIGFEVDKVNFVFCAFASLPLAYVFKEKCAVGKVSRQTRALVPLLIGLLIVLFLFGRAAKHLLANALISYAIMYLSPPKYVHILVFLFSMSYLMWIHFYRWLILTAYYVDITGPMMVAVQKITTLAFSLNDGLEKKRENLSELQKKEAITEVPSLLDYMSFIFNFQSIMSGPTNFYADYSAYIVGTHVKPNKAGEMPDSTQTAITKMYQALVYFVIIATLGNMYKPEDILTEQYLSMSYAQWIFWWYFTIVLVRCKYYYAWVWAESVCNMSGFGFSGYDSNGEAKWELCTNVQPMKVELAQSFKETLDNWNILTMGWLRRVAYDRAPKKYRTVATYFLSAVWHGVSLGYYVTFATAALFTMAGSQFRRCLRWRFLKDANSKMAYDAFTFFGTKLTLAYATYPFIAMDLAPSLAPYSRVLFAGHFIALAIYFVLPAYFPPLRREKTGEKTETTGTATERSESNETVDGEQSKNFEDVRSERTQRSDRTEIKKDL